MIYFLNFELSRFFTYSNIHRLLNFICLFYLFNQLLVKFHKQKVCPNCTNRWPNYHWQTVNHQNVFFLPYRIHHLKNCPQSWVYASSPESKPNLISKLRPPRHHWKRYHHVPKILTRCVPSLRHYQRHKNHYKKSNRLPHCVQNARPKVRFFSVRSGNNWKKKQGFIKKQVPSKDAIVAPKNWAIK